MDDKRIKIDVNGKKYTLIFDPENNDRLDEVLRYGGYWMRRHDFAHWQYQKWIMASLNKLMKLHLACEDLVSINKKGLTKTLHEKISALETILDEG
tara:strand:- start:8858 stop:9145 length:288 start_codon:yes stop_codon:yes gene_type:complete